MFDAKSIFSRFRTAQAEVQRPYHRQYHEMLKELASGAEVDYSELELCCNALQVDEPQLQRDIEKMQTRLRAAEKLRESREAEPRLAELQNKIHRLATERAEFLARVDAELFTLNEQRMHADTAYNGYISAKQDLRETVLDQDLLERIKDHDARRMALAGREREVQGKLKDWSDHRVAKVAECRRDIPWLESQKQRTRDQDARLRKLRDELRQCLPYVKELESQLDDIRAEFRKLDRESDELEKLKLVP